MNLLASNNQANGKNSYSNAPRAFITQAFFRTVISFLSPRSYHTDLLSGQHDCLIPLTNICETRFPLPPSKYHLHCRPTSTNVAADNMQRGGSPFRSEKNTAQTKQLDFPFRQSRLQGCRPSARTRALSSPKRETPRNRKKSWKCRLPAHCLMKCCFLKRKTHRRLRQGIKARNIRDIGQKVCLRLNPL